MVERWHVDMDYKKLIEESYRCNADTSGEETRLQYISRHLFHLDTYDDNMDDIFGMRALETCAAINNSTTFDYIKDKDNYMWYLCMCNMPFLRDKITWGSSIRGAFWDVPIAGGIKFSSCGLWQNGHQIHEMTFSHEEWMSFIAELVIFASDEMKEIAR